MILVRYKSFSKKRDEDSKLENYKSNKGIGASLLSGLPGLTGGETVRDRSNLLALPLLASGIVGRHIGNRVATNMDNDGEKSDSKILRRSTLNGALTGAATSMLTGIPLGMSRGKVSTIALMSGALGGLGGAIGTHASVKDRLNKRKKYVDREE